MTGIASSHKQTTSVSFFFCVSFSLPKLHCLYRVLNFYFKYSMYLSVELLKQSILLSWHCVCVHPCIWMFAYSLCTSACGSAKLKTEWVMELLSHPFWLLYLVILSRGSLVSECSNYREPPSLSQFYVGFEVSNSCPEHCRVPQSVLYCRYKTPQPRQLIKISV